MTAIRKCPACRTYTSALTQSCNFCGHKVGDPLPGEDIKVVYANTSPPDPTNPPHYRSHPSGIECIEITRHMSFNLGNAIKYIWRADEKGNALEDLRKAQWYIEDEIKKRSK